MPRRANLEARIAVTLSLSIRSPHDFGSGPSGPSGPMNPVSKTTQPAASSCGNPAATRGRESRALCSLVINTFQSTASQPLHRSAARGVAESAQQPVYRTAPLGTEAGAGLMALVRHWPFGAQARAP